MNLNKENFIQDYKRKMISMYQVSVEEAPDMIKYMTLGCKTLYAKGDEG